MCSLSIDIFLLFKLDSQEGHLPSSPAVSDMTANIRAVVEDVVKSMLGNTLSSNKKQSSDVGSIIRAVLEAQGM